MAAIDESVGDLHLATVVTNVQDMNRAVDFWPAAAGYVRRERDRDPEFMMLVDPARRRLPISLQLTDSGPKEPVRVHLDLYTRGQARHIERVARLRATRVDDWPYPEDAARS